MLSFLRGTIMAKLPHALVVELHDVGYRVVVSESFFDRLRVGERVELYCHEVVREDRRELFGVPTQDALLLFLDLITVSGVGPKVAIGVLGLGTPREIRAAIAREDATYLSKVVGVGRKTAERVVVELKSKMQDEGAVDLPGAVRSDADGDVVDALVQLGYKLQEVREVIRRLPASAATTEEKLKVALQHLAKP